MPSTAHSAPGRYDEAIADLRIVVAFSAQARDVRSLITSIR
ncbi:hypothetical protein OG542_37810 [Streptomyces violaceus]